MYLYIGLCAVCFALVHLFKMIRLYLVLMQQRIPFGQFLLLYFRTTLVNLIVPFKLGEIYRIEEIARKTRVWQVGILSVVVDRFFDTLALLVLLVPADYIASKRISSLSAIFFIVLFVAVVLYIAIPSSYSYLNQYLIMRKSSVRTMGALKTLDIIKSWYDYTKDLISGRYMLILIASFLGWIAEICTLKALAIYLSKPFGFSDFAAYVGAVLQTGQESLQVTYTKMGVVCMAVLVIVGYLIYGVKSVAKKNS